MDNEEERRREMIFVLGSFVRFDVFRRVSMSGEGTVCLRSVAIYVCFCFVLCFCVWVCSLFYICL